MTSVAEGLVTRPLERASSVRTATAVAVFTALLFAVVAVVAGLLIDQSYRAALARAEARAQSAAHVVSAHVQWLVEASRQSLRRVDEALGPKPDTFPVGTPGALDKAVAALPGQVAVWVFDADGDSVLTNDPLAAEVNVADREYFQALRAGSEWHIARLLTSKVGPVKAFGIGRRIERDGRFMGVAIIAVRAELMAEFWASLDLGRDSTVGLIRDDGWLVARYPVPDDTMDLSGHVLFTTHLPQAPEGSYSSGESPADGVGRIVGYRRVPNAPLIAVAGLARDTMLAAFWWRVGMATLLAAPVLALLLAGALWIVRLLRRDERTRAELAATLDQNRFLLRETHHRIKNNLQTVSSLVHLHPGTPESKETMFRRLAAMSAVHEHIYRSDQYAVLDLSEYLPTLIAGLEDGHGSAATVRHRLAPMEMDADRAQALGLIVSEVVSNAFKHAFPDGRAGAITVELDRIDPATARLRISDDGIGFAAGRETSGMGGRLVSGFVQRLDGECTYDGGSGTVFTMTFPLTEAPAGRPTHASPPRSAPPASRA